MHRRIEAMVLLMLYTGLRISDTCLSGPAQLNAQTGEFVVRKRMKTGVPVTTFLPPGVAAKVAELPLLDGKPWFHTGEGTIETVTGNAPAEAVQARGRS